MKRIKTMVHPLRRKRGAVAVLTMIMLVVLVGMASLTIDVGYLYNIRAEMQNTADAAALAAAQRLPDQTAARETALEYSHLNNSNNGSVVDDSDIVFGYWDYDAGVFTPGPPVNAVHVLASRSNAHGNPVTLFFAGIFGITQTEVSASATAALGVGVRGRTRFLIDNEAFDTDEPALEALADRLGTTTVALLKDADGDDFVDIPGGEVLELPTGQIGDAGLFAIGPEFEYTDDSSPSILDFLLYAENGNRRGITDHDLDSLLGVEPVSDPALYPTFVDPNFVHVSPLYKSDVSDTNPWVNAKGLRYGLVAYKIIGVGVDPDGSGSRLPNLIFEIVDHSEITLYPVDLFTSGAPPQLVQ